jgi:hypothetical protein
LATGTQQAIVKPFGVAADLEFFGFEAEMSALKAVNAPGAAGAVAVVKVTGRSNM